ncbi:MAG: hypothetical protein KA316_22500 [Rhodoferax sp.]|nr:hypothetical protein [Rhodoferax sp.]
MDSRNKQIPRPRHWQEFEELCLALFREVWKDALAQKNGRTGQPQHGVDVWGAVDGNRSTFQGVQCKGKDESLGASVTEAELIAEIGKADKFEPALEHWVLATTAPADAEIERVAREISVSRESHDSFTVQVMGWSDIESLLFRHVAVLEQFYPELGLDATTLARAVRQIANAAPPGAPQSALVANESNASSWRAVTYDSGRDIGPALLGRPLGPTDALACPRLPEADAAVRQLETAFSARLVGEPGTGKSVCAFQAAHTFALRGWMVLTLRSADGLPTTLPVQATEKVVLLVDDAHLVSESDLRALEAQATSHRLVLSTHNAIEGRAAQRGAVRMDPQTAIRAIAAGLLADRRSTLEAVRRADAHVGDLMMDDALEERIEQAARYATVPWQFCFVLGGGWRRANEAAKTAIALGAALPLAAVAIRQLASRDARCSHANVEQLLTAASVDTSTLNGSINALVGDRLVLAADDLRCPHQRLAGVLLGSILQRQDEAAIASVAAMLNAVLADPSLPLGGLGTLLHELRFTNDGRWHRLVERAVLEPLMARCWSSSSPNDVTTACFVLTEIASYMRGGSSIVIEGNEPKLVSWIEQAVDPMGHGLARLLNSVLNEEQDVAVGLTRKADPAVISTLISNVDARNVWHVAELAKCLRLGAGDDWAKAVVDNLDRVKLLSLASSWPKDEPIHRIISLFEALVWPAEEMTLDMVEAFLPTARERLIADPVVQFRDLDDLAWHVLRVLDPLGVYTGKLAPTVRQLRIAKALFEGVDVADLATKLSHAPLRMFQQVSYLLALLHRVSRTKYTRLVKLMDWNAVGSTIGGHWKHLPHDPEVLFGVAACTRDSRSTIATFIARNVDHMAIMPARMAIVAPETAVEFVRNGKTIALASFSHVEWRYGAFVIQLFAEKAPELLPIVLKQCIPTVAESLSAADKSWYEEGAPMLEAMLNHAPASMHQVLDLISIEKAAVGWRAAWKARSGSRRTVDVLLRAAGERTDAIGDFSRQFSKSRSTKLSVR